MDNTKKIMVTTIDNPFNPFTDFDAWMTCDLQLGYNTCGTLASLVYISSELSDNLNEEEENRAIDQLVNGDLKGVFIKVSPESYKDDGKIVPED